MDKRDPPRYNKSEGTQGFVRREEVPHEVVLEHPGKFVGFLGMVWEKWEQLVGSREWLGMGE